MPNKNKYSKKELLDIIHKYINKFDNVKKGGGCKRSCDNMEGTEDMGETKQNVRSSRRLKQGSISTISVSCLIPSQVDLIYDDWDTFNKVKKREEEGKESKFTKVEDLKFKRIVFVGFEAALASIVSIINNDDNVMTSDELKKYKSDKITDIQNIVYTLNSGNYIITKENALIIYERDNNQIEIDDQLNNIDSHIKSIVDESKCSSVEKSMGLSDVQKVEIAEVKAKVKAEEIEKNMLNVLNKSYEKIKHLESIFNTDGSYNVITLISQLEELTKILKKVVKHKSVIHEITKKRLYNIINEIDNDDEYTVRVYDEELIKIINDMKITKESISEKSTGTNKESEESKENEENE